MLYSIVGILVVILDQAVKFWVQNTLFGSDIVKFIPGVVSLVNVQNSGAAFGWCWLLPPISSPAVSPAGALLWLPPAASAT